jgi:hypothetical protein
VRLNRTRPSWPICPPSRSDSIKVVHISTRDLPHVIPLPLPRSFLKIHKSSDRFGWGRNVEAPNICCIFSLVSGAIVDGNAASTLKMTCSGNLNNTRADGVTLGQCDLNFLSVKAMTEIENVCGIPGTIDTPAENQCRIRAVVTPDPSSAADHRKLYRVLELWSVDKR